MPCSKVLRAGRKYSFAYGGRPLRHLAGWVASIKVEDQSMRSDRMPDPSGHKVGGSSPSTVSNTVR